MARVANGKGAHIAEPRRMKSPDTATELPEGPLSDASPDAEALVSGSSFYAAMRILPSSQRRAMFEIYRFCRAVGEAPS